MCFKKMLVLAVMVAASVVCGQIDWSAPNITITTEAQLRELADRVNNSSRSFRGQTITLGADITLANEWVPIGRPVFDFEGCFWFEEDEFCIEYNRDLSFDGVFDGNGHSISNMSISGDFRYAGFFGIVGEDVQIKNLTVNVAGINISGNFPYANDLLPVSIGGLIGVAHNNVTVMNSHTTGDISIDISADVGGLVGTSRGITITNSSATGNVSTIFQTYIGFPAIMGGSAGGLIGRIIAWGDVVRAIITLSYTTGNVSGRWVGGLVGGQGQRAILEITNSYTTGDVFADPFNSWNRGADAGGFVGSGNGIILNNSYVGGIISATGELDIFVGGIAGRGQIIPPHPSSVYYNSEGTNIPLANASDFALRQLTGVKSVSSAELRIQSTFVDWDFEEIWGINPNINDGMPFLRAFHQECDHTWSAWSEWDTIATATCITIGSRKRRQICSKCNEINEETENIIALGHLWDNWGNWTTTTAPTCDSDGVRIRIAECRRMSCEADTTQIGAIPQLTGDDCPSSIRGRQDADSRYGIFLENAVVSDLARISVITPEPATANLRILDNLGNVVFTADNVGATALGRPQQSPIIWNLTNNAGRFVANGTYLILVEATSISGRRFIYSSRIGVNR